jgi:antitoxin component YwqK of YwqJK toxin-antitoxin module
MRLLATIIIIALLILGCKSDQSKIKIEYYGDGSKKTEYSTDSKGVLNGVSRSFYPNGNLKYVGEYVDGFRVGDHKEYYSNGNLMNHFTYTIVDGNELNVIRKKYDEDGLILFDGKVVNAKFSFIELSDRGVFPGDTMKLLVKLEEPTFFNSVVFLGDYDPYLKINKNSNEVLEFDGKGNEVIVAVVVNAGENIIKGLFRDFTFETYPNNDTLAYTVAEESYFEYRFSVKDKKEI